MTGVLSVSGRLHATIYNNWPPLTINHPKGLLRVEPHLIRAQTHGRAILLVQRRRQLQQPAVAHLVRVPQAGDSGKTGPGDAGEGAGNKPVHRRGGNDEKKGQQQEKQE